MGPSSASGRWADGSSVTERPSSGAIDFHHVTTWPKLVWKVAFHEFY